MHRHRFVLPLVLALCSGAAARAAVYAPTKLADSADGACDADCSLREAVQAANAHAGDDVVLLGQGKYELTIAGADDSAAAGDLDVLDHLTVIGAGAPRTSVDGGAIDRILHVQHGATLTVRDVTLRNGRVAGDGGAMGRRQTGSSKPIKAIAAFTGIGLLSTKFTFINGRNFF